jgi:hypothetical protein
VIVRILGEAQYEIPDGERDALGSLDAAVAKAVDNEDSDAFTQALAELTSAVRRLGTPLADDDFAPSDLVVPFPDATLQETKVLLTDPVNGSGTEER